MTAAKPCLYFVTADFLRESGPEFVTARSWREVCYRVCRKFGIPVDADVPDLYAENIFDTNDAGYAENGGRLED